jgi:uncharacterized protein
MKTVKGESPMSEQDNIALVQKVYNDFKSGNIQALLGAMAEDITWEVPEMPHVPIGGRREGRHSVAQFFQTLGELQEPLNFEANDFIAEGNRVVAMGSYEWRVKETGRSFTGKFAHVFTLVDGIVVAFLEYTDTGASARAYEKVMSA